jgi:hypothetical protein
MGRHLGMTTRCRQAQKSYPTKKRKKKMKKKKKKKKRNKEKKEKKKLIFFLVTFKELELFFNSLQYRHRGGRRTF